MTNINVKISIKYDKIIAILIFSMTYIYMARNDEFH